jgi:hypothetical protein
MSDGYVLDAHTLIWFLENNRRLGLRAKAALLDVTARLFVPAIALAVGEIHDRQIVATALELIARGEKVVLLTTDANISSSGLVPIVW